MPSNRVRVLVASPQRLFLDVLCDSLSGVSDIAIVAETTNARRAIQLARASMPEVAVLDYVFSKPSRLGLVRALHAKGIGSVIICPSAIQQLPNGGRSEGVSEFVLVEEPIGTLIAAIRKLAHRDSVRLKGAPRPRGNFSDKLPSILTSQEIVVLRLLAKALVHESLLTSGTASTQLLETSRR